MRIGAQLEVERHIDNRRSFQILKMDRARGNIVVSRRVVDVEYGRVTDHGRIVYQPGSLPFADVAPDAGYDMPATVLFQFLPMISLT